ncbi:MAG: YncE family protein [Flammeovirgaceae bacterium]
MLKNLFMFRVLWYGLIVIAFSSCIKDEFSDIQNFDFKGTRGVWVVNEGNFLFENASLSYILLETGDVFSEVFFKTNGVPLGDVAQSIHVWENKAFVVVNNSQKVYVIDVFTGKFLGKITELVSPRYIQIISDKKAYVTDLYAQKIAIVNPSQYTVTGWIDVKNGISNQHSTEQMCKWGDSVFVSCWLNDRTVLLIDSQTDKVVDSVQVGIQPNSMVIDKYQKLWVLCDGGLATGLYGRKKATLHCIDLASLEVEITYTFANIEDSPHSLSINSEKDTLYFINKDVYKMSVKDVFLPKSAFIERHENLFYGLGVSPYNNEVFVADAIDYVQNGIIYRYSSSGKLLEIYEAGIIPSKFYFMEK